MKTSPDKIILNERAEKHEFWECFTERMEVATANPPSASKPALEPTMSPAALRAMLARNMGQPLSPVTDWNSK
ncbi:MAG TPA: hypothetical protein PLB55_07990 [Prosthecobacter sp.]|nr:hypothetical protein [Prosthecobacter sp.]